VRNRCIFLSVLVALTITTGGAQSGDWQQLWNGKDLTGWQAVNDGVFSVTNGTLHATYREITSAIAHKSTLAPESKPSTTFSLPDRSKRACSRYESSGEHSRSPGQHSRAAWPGHITPGACHTPGGCVVTARGQQLPIPSPSHTRNAALVAKKGKSDSRCLQCAVNDSLCFWNDRMVVFPSCSHRMHGKEQTELRIRYEATCCV